MLGIPSKNYDNHLSLLHVGAFLPTHMEHSDCLITLAFFSCQVQQEVLQKRQKEKKAMMEAVKSYKKRKYRHLW